MPGMHSPEDWDYAALGARLRELIKPPFIPGESTRGKHCWYCPQSDTEVCSIHCRDAYRALHGFDPPKG